MLTERDKRILAALPLNTKEIWEKFFTGLAYQSCHQRLKVLEKHGYIKRKKVFEVNSYIWEVEK